MKRRRHAPRIDSPAAMAAGRCIVAFVGLLGMLSAQRNALASCGDYVLVRDASGRLVPASQLSRGGQGRAQHRQEPAERPCRGPACSGLPGLPPAVPAAPVVIPQSPDALLCDLGAREGDFQSSRWRIELFLLLPIHDPGRIFRPPRA